MTNNLYAEQWQRMRRIHRQLLLSFLVGPIGWLLIHFLFDPKDHHTPVVRVFLVAWVLFGAWTAHQYMIWPCPRCGHRWQGESFWHVVGPWYILLLRHRCPHCGLELP